MCIKPDIRFSHPCPGVIPTTSASSCWLSYSFCFRPDLPPHTYRRPCRPEKTQTDSLDDVSSPLDFEVRPLLCNREDTLKSHRFNQLLLNTVLQCRSAVSEEELRDLLKQEMMQFWCKLSAFLTTDFLYSIHNKQRSILAVSRCLKYHKILKKLHKK